MLAHVGCASRPLVPGAPAADAEAIAAPPDPAARAEAYYAFSLAQRALDQGDGSSAKQLLARAIALDPDSAYLYTFRAGIDLSGRDAEGATRSLQEALRVDPFYPPALYLYGGLMVAMGKTDDAIAAYERALAADSKSIDVYLYLVDLYLQRKDLGRARAMAGRMVMRFPEAAAGYFYRARVLLQEGKSAEAEEQLRAALERDPQNEEVLLVLGTLLERAGRRADAIALYRAQVEQMPDNARLRDRLVGLHIEAQEWDAAEQENDELAALGADPGLVERNRGMIAMGRGRNDDAARAFERALVADPADDRSRYSLGLALLRAKSYDAALAAFGAIEETSPIRAEGRFGVGYACRELGRYAEALAALDDALRLDAENDEFHRLRALVLADLGRFDEAVAELRAAIERNADDLTYRFALGTVYEKAARFDDGVAVMKEVLALDPENADANNYIGYTYADQGVRLDEAEKHLARAIAKKPGDPFITDSLGWLAHKQGRQSEALKSLLAAAAQLPDEAVILEHLGAVYAALGDAANARRSLEKALTLAKEAAIRERIAQRLRALAP
jgi:tetratricopeptide (TPR) repeat protein